MSTKPPNTVDLLDQALERLYVAQRQRPGHRRVPAWALSEVRAAAHLLEHAVDRLDPGRPRCRCGTSHFIPVGGEAEGAA